MNDNLYSIRITTERVDQFKAVLLYELIASEKAWSESMNRIVGFFVWDGEAWVEESLAAEFISKMRLIEFAYLIDDMAERVGGYIKEFREALENDPELTGEYLKEYEETVKSWGPDGPEDWFTDRDELDQAWIDALDRLDNEGGES